MKSITESIFDDDDIMDKANNVAFDDIEKWLGNDPEQFGHLKGLEIKSINNVFHISLQTKYSNVINDIMHRVFLNKAPASVVFDDIRCTDPDYKGITLSFMDKVKYSVNIGHLDKLIIKHLSRSGINPAKLKINSIDYLEISHMPFPAKYEKEYGNFIKNASPKKLVIKELFDIKKYEFDFNWLKTTKVACLDKDIFGLDGLNYQDVYKIKDDNEKLNKCLSICKNINIYSSTRDGNKKTMCVYELTRNNGEYIFELMEKRTI